MVNKEDCAEESVGFDQTIIRQFQPVKGSGKTPVLDQVTCLSYQQLRKEKAENSEPPEKDVQDPEKAERANKDVQDAEQSLNKDDQDTEKRAHGHRKTILLVIFCLVRFSLAAFVSLMAPFFPQMAADRGVSKTMIGLIFSCYQLASLVSAPAIGWLMPRIGTRFLYVAGLLVTGVCSLLFGFLDRCPPGASYIVLCIAVRSVEGVSAACVSSVGLTITTSAFPDKVASVTGSLVMFYSIGLIIGPSIGGALYQVGGFELPFIFFGVLLFLMGLTVSTINIAPATPEPSEEETQKSSATYLTLLGNPMVMIMLLFMFLDLMVVSFNDATLSLYLAEQLSPGMIGVVFLAIALCFGVMCPVIGRLGDKKIHLSPMLNIIGFMIGGVSLLFVGPAPFFHLPRSLWLTIVSHLVCGASVCVTVLVFPTILDALEKQGYKASMNLNGLVSGLRYTSMTAGGLVGPLLGGVLTEKFGYQNASAAVGFIMFLPPFFMIIYLTYLRCKQKKIINLRHQDENTPLLTKVHTDGTDGLKQMAHRT